MVYTSFIPFAHAGGVSYGGLITRYPPGVIYMLAMTTAPVARPAANPWITSLYAGVFTAVMALIGALLFQANTGYLWVAAMLLIGIGPIIGYQLAVGRFGDWKSLLGGLIGALPALSILLWPILVGALTKGQSIGKLFLWHLIGIVLGVAVFFLLATVMGQDPSWVGFGYVMAYSVWGGTVGAAMASSVVKVA